MSKHYNENIRRAIANFLQETGWDYTFQEEEGLFRYGLTLTGKLRNVEFLLRIRETDYTVYGLIPVSAESPDDDTLQQLCEFLHRANYGLRNGNFEFDHRDQEIRYKTYVNCKDLQEPTEGMIRDSIFCNASICERYGKGIGMIVFAGMGAEDALALCESIRSREPAGREDSNLHILPHEEDAEDVPEEEADADVLRFLAYARDGMDISAIFDEDEAGEIYFDEAEEASDSDEEDSCPEALPEEAEDEIPDLSELDEEELAALMRLFRKMKEN